MENCKLGLATIKKDRADEGSTKLMEDQKREKEVALAKGLDQKQKLEFEIAQLKDKLRVIEHYLHGEEDIYKFIDQIHKKGEEEKKGLEELLDTLLMDHRANQKLTEVRAELIEGLTKMLKGRALIGIKRMDDLHIKPFELECKNFSAKNADSKALELCSSSDKICNPSWRPSKTTECDGHFEAAMVDSYLALAHVEKKRYDEKVKEHIEEHKRDMEVALTRVRQLEMELDQKQKLELEIAHLKGKLKVMEHLQGEEDIDKKIAEHHNKLEQEKEHLEELHNTLFLKERVANQELNEARAELIQNFEGLTKYLQVPYFIGIKRMGDLDIKPFESACKKKFPAEEATMKASVLCSTWDAAIRDPLWHPFKFIKRDGVNEEVIDENDPKMKSLLTDFGDDVYNAVKKALLEINDYNPSGRYPVAELWNRKEDRKVEMKEAIHYIGKQYKTPR